MERISFVDRKHNKALQLTVLLISSIMAYYYPHMPIGKVWIYRLLFVCSLFVCLFVRLRISPPRIKLAASNSAQRFIVVQGRESHILGNFSPSEAQNRTNWPAREGRWMFQLVTPRCAYQVRAVFGRRIGMCGYTSVAEDGRTCWYIVWCWNVREQQWASVQ